MLKPTEKKTLADVVNELRGASNYLAICVSGRMKDGEERKTIDAVILKWRTLASDTEKLLGGGK